MEKYLRPLLIPLGLFLFFFLVTATLNRFASDDFELISKLHEYGVTGSVIYNYDNWNTRWIAIGFLNLMLLMSLWLESLFVFHMLSVTLLWYAFYRLATTFSKVSPAGNLVLSGFMVASFFYATFSISQIFFWMNASSMYLFGCIALLFGLGEISKCKHTLHGYFILIVSGLYAGGSYEPLVFTLVVVCVCFLMIKFFIDKRVIPTAHLAKVFVFIGFMLLAFSISLLGEGHVVRSSFLPQTSVSFKLWVWTKAVLKMLVLHMPVKLLLAFAFSVPWFFIGMHKPFTVLTGKLIFKITFLLIFLVMVSLFPLAMVMSEMGPQRAWAQITVYIVLYASVVLAWLGSRYKVGLTSRKMLNYVIVLSGVISGVGLTMAMKDFNYCKAYDIRMEQLYQYRESKQDGIVTVNPLPETGWLYSAEIETYPNHFTNRHLKNYLKAEFDIVRK